MRQPIGLITYSLYPNSLSKLNRKWNMAAFEVEGEQMDVLRNVQLRDALAALVPKYSVVQPDHKVAIDYTPYSKLPKRSGRLTVEEKSFFDQAVKDFDLTEAERLRIIGADRPLYKRMLDPGNRGEIFSYIERQRAAEFAAQISLLEEDLKQMLGGDVRRLLE